MHGCAILKYLRTWGSQEHWVVLPATCHLGPQPRRPPSSHPNTRHCLGIHVTLTKELGAVPPYCLMPGQCPWWKTWYAMPGQGFTKAVVTGPGRAVLFYGRHSLGEGLSLDARLGMLQSYLLEWVLGLGNQPILLLTPWQSKKADRQLPRP